MEKKSTKKSYDPWQLQSRQDSSDEWLGCCPAWACHFQFFVLLLAWLPLYIVRYCSSSALKLACPTEKCIQAEPWNFFLKNKALTLRAFRGPGQAGFAHVRATKLTAPVVSKCEQDSFPFCKSWMAKISQFLFPFSFMESCELGSLRCMDFDHHTIGPRVESQIYLWVGHHGKNLSGFIPVVFLRLLSSGPRSALISKTPYITLILFYKIIKRGKFSPRQFTSMTDMAHPIITAASLTLLSLVIPWSDISLNFMLNELLFTVGLNLKNICGWNVIRC